MKKGPHMLVEGVGHFGVEGAGHAGAEACDIVLGSGRDKYRYLYPWCARVGAHLCRVRALVRGYVCTF